MRFLVAIVACVIAAFAVGAYLAIPANPEVRFWREVVELREAEIETVRKQAPPTPIIFFTGGSSCAFSIDPAIIEQSCGLSAFNLGLPVAGGGKYLVHQALAQAREGDILAVCLEPDILSHYIEDGRPTKFSFIMSSAAGTPSEASGGETFGQSPAIRDYLNFSRPGPAYLSTLAAKMIVGRGYRYTTHDIRYRGRVETSLRDDGMRAGGISKATRLSADGRVFLETIIQVAFKRHVTVVYSMPWHFTAEESLIECRINHQSLMNDIRTIMPAIDDGFAGAVSDASYFSDTPLHLSAAGAAHRSRALGAVLSNWLTANFNLPPR